MTRRFSNPRGIQNKYCVEIFIKHFKFEKMTESVAPSAVYSVRSEPVGLRIATGGSGQSGLLEALAKEFVK